MFKIFEKNRFCLKCDYSCSSNDFIILFSDSGSYYSCLSHILIDCAAQYEEHKNVERFVNAPLREFDSDRCLSHVRNEFKFLIKHADRLPNEITFMKCQLFKSPGNECEYCAENPPLLCPAYQYEKAQGGFMFEPVASTTNEGHYKT